MWPTLKNDQLLEDDNNNSMTKLFLWVDRDVLAAITFSGAEMNIQKLESQQRNRDYENNEISNPENTIMKGKIKSLCRLKRGL